MRFTHGKKRSAPAQAREWLEYCLLHQPAPEKASQSAQDHPNAKFELFLACCMLGLCILASYVIALAGLRAVENMLQASPYMMQGHPPSSFRF